MGASKQAHDATVLSTSCLLTSSNHVASAPLMDARLGKCSSFMSTMTIVMLMLKPNSHDKICAQALVLVCTLEAVVISAKCPMRPKPVTSVQPLAPASASRSAAAALDCCIVSNAPVQQFTDSAQGRNVAANSLQNACFLYMMHWNHSALSEQTAAHSGDGTALSACTCLQFKYQW